MRTLLLVAALAFAGCVAPPIAEPPVESDTADASAPSSLEAMGCIQAGGHSTYDKTEFDSYGILPAPWESADVTEDLGGAPIVSSEGFVGVHDGDAIVGNYHVSVVCESHVVDGEEKGPLAFGFVTIRVEAPPFDTGGADRHYLITMLSFAQPEAAALLQGLGIAAGEANDVVVADEGLFTYTRFDDPGHGVYESRLRFEESGKVPARVTRLWLLVGQGGRGGDGAVARPEAGHSEGPYRPVAIDLIDTESTHLVTRMQGTFSHWGTADHAFFDLPGIGPTPDRADGHIPGVGFAGFDRTIRAGPQPDLVLPEMYAHK